MTAPFGSFSCERDWEDWEYEASYLLDAIPEVDGDWTVTVTHTNGTVGSTVVAFAQTNGTAIADIMTCPQLITPDLSGSEPLFRHGRSDLGMGCCI